MADFSELKAAIRADIKDNDEQEIGGDLLQGDLLRMVDDINAAKVDKIEGKGLSTNDFTDEDKEKLDSIPSDICPDVPADAPSPLYGRTPTHEWQPIALVSGLHIELTIPSSANPDEFEIILSYGDGSVRRAIEYVDGGLTLTDIPAGMRVTVNVKPPHNYTAPRSKIYTSQLGVIENYTGTSIYIVDGVYVLDKWGGFTPWDSWNTADNANARGVGYMSSSLAFVVGKYGASCITPSVGTLVNESIAFGFMNESASGHYMFGTNAQEDYYAEDCFIRNNAALLEYHAINQPHWQTDAQIVTTTNGYAPAAAAAARYVGVEGDVVGDWGLPDGIRSYVYNNNETVRTALERINGRGLKDYALTCVPQTNNKVWACPAYSQARTQQRFIAMCRAF